jgi:hypothetical protein
MSSKQRRLVGKLDKAGNLQEYRRLKKQLEGSFESGARPRWVRVSYSDLNKPPALEYVRNELDNLRSISNDSPFIEQVALLRQLLERSETAIAALEELPRARQTSNYRAEVTWLYKTYADQVTAYVRENREFGMAVLGVLDPSLDPEGVEQLVREFRGE